MSEGIFNQWKGRLKLEAISETFDNENGRQVQCQAYYDLSPCWNYDIPKFNKAGSISEIELNLVSRLIEGKNGINRYWIYFSEQKNCAILEGKIHVPEELLNSLRSWNHVFIDITGNASDLIDWAGFFSPNFSEREGKLSFLGYFAKMDMIDKNQD